MRARLAAADPAMAARVIGGLVDVALRAARPLLVRAERVEIARRLAGGPDDVDALADAVGLAADLGVNPVGLADGGVDGAGAEPYAAAEWMVQRCLERERPEPTIEADAATLRRLTTAPSALRPELIVGTDFPGPLGLAHRLYRSYGLTAPRVRLGLADRPPSQVRFAFGAGGRSAAHLVPPDDLVAITLPPRFLAAPAVPYLDPFLGEPWSLVRVDRAAEALLGTTGTRVLDPAALVLNALLAEMATRLPLWAPVGDALGVGDLGAIRGVPLPATAAAVRRLLASRVSLQGNVRLKEAAVLLAAEGVEAVDGIETGLRALLGRAVVPPTVPTTDVEVVEVDAALADAAVAAGSVEVLLRALPRLGATSDEIVVTVPHARRREVERLLAALADVLLVVAAEEYALLPVAPTSMPTAPV